MKDQSDKQTDISKLDIQLSLDIFLRNLIRALAGVLEDVVGLDQASGFFSVVGQHIGDQIDSKYKDALNVPCLSREQVEAVLVDLKRRINGDFYVIESNSDKIVLGSRSCPFADEVRDRKSMCMMTSNVFGCITAENLGYAKVVLKNTIAEGDRECLIVVYLTPGLDADASNGREYHKSKNYDV